MPTESRIKTADSPARSAVRTNDISERKHVMVLKSGNRLGSYEVLAPLGAGGMGEVYRAHDTRLNRTVALKVLSAHVLSAGRDLRRRFEMEARAIAALNHPHICTLYDIGRQDGVDFLVMEYVEGETLSERLRKGALPVAQAIEFAIQIAGALDWAHRHGIVHRDLKPSNIMVAKAGAKLLDFGLAKLQPAHTPVEDGAATATAPPGLTNAGTILGTVQYMAPEQLEGVAADARSDLFAFGAVLFEMVSGRAAFEGKTQTALITSILQSEPPPLSTVQPLTPVALDRLVKVALAKNPDDRWQSAGDLVRGLKWIADDVEHGKHDVTGVPAGSIHRRERLPWVLAAGGLLVALFSAVAGSFLSFARPRPPVEPKVARFLLTPPPQVQITRLGPISPDGRNMVFRGRTTVGRSALWLQPLDSLEARSLAGTDDATGPFWSPDSRFVAFFTPEGQLKKVNISGGPPELIAEAAVGRGGATWSEQNIIVLSPAVDGPLLQLPASGGTPAPLTTLDASSKQLVHQWPVFLPDGHRFLYASREEDGRFAIYAASLDSPRSTRIVKINSAFTYAAPGFLLYLRGETLMAQRFDSEHLQLVGDAQPVAEPLVLPDPHQPGTFWASNDGVLVYQSRRLDSEQFVWLDRTGRILRSVGPAGTYRSFALSPDAGRVAVERIGPEPGFSDLWIIDSERDIPTRLTFDAWQESCLIWSPGTRIVFCSSRAGRWDTVQKVPVPGGEETLLLDGRPPHHSAAPSDWSPTGDSLIYQESPGGLYLLSLSGPRESRLLPFTKSASRGTFSPDGNLIAFDSNESGVRQVYVMSLKGSHDKWQVSKTGGMWPKWRRDGKELIYRAPDLTMVSADVDPGPPFRVQSERALFRAPFLESWSEENVTGAFSMTSDGQRFLVKRAVEGAAAPVTVVLNWTAALKE
jgi:eukaryotic-like serine/threonine-protein kinase